MRSPDDPCGPGCNQRFDGLAAVTGGLDRESHFDWAARRPRLRHASPLPSWQYVHRPSLQAMGDAPVTRRLRAGCSARPGGSGSSGWRSFLATCNRPSTLRTSSTWSRRSTVSRASHLMSKTFCRRTSACRRSWSSGSLQIGLVVGGMDRPGLHLTFGDASPASGDASLSSVITFPFRQRRAKGDEGLFEPGGAALALAQRPERSAKIVLRRGYRRTGRHPRIFRSLCGEGSSISRPPLSSRRFRIRLAADLSPAWHPIREADIGTLARRDILPILFQHHEWLR